MRAVDDGACGDWAEGIEHEELAGEKAFRSDLRELVDAETVGRGDEAAKDFPVRVEACCPKASQAKGAIVLGGPSGSS
ncbi:hypothetical protein AB1Y20_022737 [Prymnesium parvum]|uniref:Uncharacterized protein n=1 Tax=Prymnesium parvum TaxID=97485 RepID=A0AB34JIQ8_PRYPA